MVFKVCAMNSTRPLEAIACVTLYLHRIFVQQMHFNLTILVLVEVFGMFSGRVKMDIDERSQGVEELRRYFETE